MLCAVFLGPWAGLLWLCEEDSSLWTGEAEEADVWRRWGGGGEHEDLGEEGLVESESSEDLRLRPLRAGYLLSCAVEGSVGVGRPILEAEVACACDCMLLLRLTCGDWNSGLVSLTPSRPKTTSSRPVGLVELRLLFTSTELRPGLMTGMADRSGLSRSSDLRRKSDSGDCSILFHAVQSSPEPEFEKVNPPKMGDMGEPEPGEGAESGVSSAALQSSMEL